MNGRLGSIAIFTSLLRPKPDSFIMRDAFRKAFSTSSPSALSPVGAEVLATFMFLFNDTLVLLQSQKVVDRKDSAAKRSVTSISYPPAYFFFTLLIENHVVDSIHNAERTATMGVSSPRINAIPPKNSMKPPKGTMAADIPTLFNQAPPCFLWAEVSLGYPCIRNRVPTASLRIREEKSTEDPKRVCIMSQSRHGLYYKVGSYLLPSRLLQVYQVKRA